MIRYPAIYKWYNIFGASNYQGKKKHSKTLEKPVESPIKNSALSDSAWRPAQKPAPEGQPGLVPWSRTSLGISLDRWVVSFWSWPNENSFLFVLSNCLGGFDLKRLWAFLVDTFSRFQNGKVKHHKHISWSFVTGLQSRRTRSSFDVLKKEASNRRALCAVWPLKDRKVQSLLGRSFRRLGTPLTAWWCS